MTASFPLCLEQRRHAQKVSGWISIFLLIGTSAWAALPPGWADVNIGSPAMAGSASYNNGFWTLTGGGSDIWNSADQYHFASTSYNSDSILNAKALNLQTRHPGSGWTKEGLE